MSTAKLIANRLQEVFLDGKWVSGTNFKEQFELVDWHLAIKKEEGFNSIADLAFHVGYYIAGVNEYLDTGELNIRDKYSFDYSPIQSEEEWFSLTRTFCENAEKLIQRVEKMSDEELNQDFAKKEYGSLYRNLDVQIEHAYYHLGQILILKKLRS